MLRELNYLKKIIHSNFFRLDFPHKISYIVTYRCNMRCKMCNIWQKEPAEELSLKETELFFKKSNKFSWVGITGGEAFLREDILEICKIISANCVQLMAMHFATNGTKTDKIMDVVEKLLVFKNKTRLLFTLSIDGPKPLHDEIRGVEGTWDRCIDTFLKLKKIKSVEARIGFTLSHRNLDKFVDTFESLKAVYPPLRFDDITVNVFQKSNFYYSNENLEELNYPQTLESIGKILEMDKEKFTLNNFLRRRYLKLYPRFVEHKKCPVRCQALSSSCILDPQGYLYPCSIYNNKIAHIREKEYDLGAIWSHPYTREISERCSRSACPSCWSPCDAYSSITGSLFRPDSWR
ncbi:MAG: radical SAM protein [Candidatus Omnitrophica bacterium]|nr:radical SAM protein [Candidatus Omnitrophota bacterium]